MPGLQGITAAEAARLARRHRPILLTCHNEPYPPGLIGYSIFTEASRSPSTDFDLVPVSDVVIEYAVWFDWDIGHLYDLEHIWVHVSAGGGVVHIEGSRHGRRVALAGCPVAAGRPVVCLEPGKHALWPTPAAMAAEHERIVEACGRRAGADGVHVDNPFGERGLIAAEPLDHRLARLKLRRDAFAPEFDFHPGPGETARLVPWTELAAFIPARVGELMARNRVSVPHLSAVFLDCGDTIVDEGTEIKDQATDVVSSADLIPGARAMLDGLGKRGHRLALVADGPRATFVNVLGAHGLWDHFEAHVISGDLGVAKPHPRMFATAMTALGLLPNAAGRVVMVGNNLERDIKGANEAGIISVFMSWSDRRSHTPRDASETPDYTIARPDLLPDLLDDIELGLPVCPG